MTDRRVKPCATCGHKKSIHRTRSCRHFTTKRGRTFMGVSTIHVYCQCGGYVERTERARPATDSILDQEARP